MVPWVLCAQYRKDAYSIKVFNCRMCDPKNIPKDVEIKGKFSTSLRNIDYNDKNQFAHSTNNSQFTFNAKNSQGL